MMEDNLHRDRPLEDIAQAVNLSSSRLRHLFKAETGMPFAQYLKLIRMRKAKELIETTFLSIKQIMDRTGMRDKGHFARDFKRTYGSNPTEYRALHLKNDRH